MIRTIAYLKTLFQTGDVPTQSDFEDLFDTFGQWHLMLESLGASQDNAQMAWLCLPANITFPVGFAGSAGAAQVAPAAEYTITVNFRRAGSIVASGTIVIAIDGAFTFTLAQAYTSALGDVLELRGQATADTALANVSVTLLATI